MPDIWIDTEGGKFQAYVGIKRDSEGPGILLIQEIFGVNQTIRDLADDLSLLGYVVICPDLFWRIKPGIKLNPESPAEREQAFEYYKQFDVDKGVADLKTTLAHLRALPGFTGKVGTIGYCLGGKLAYLMMTRSDVDCGVSYYGVGIENLLDEAANITKPFMMMLAGKDRFVPPEAQEKIQLALQSHPALSLHRFPDQEHAFARVGGEHHHPAAAKVANDMAAGFLQKHLS
jgi:carboxymethylenebutenolidase